MPFKEVLTKTYSSIIIIFISLKIRCVGAYVTLTMRTYLGIAVTTVGPERRVRHITHSKSKTDYHDV